MRAFTKLPARDWASRPILLCKLGSRQAIKEILQGFGPAGLLQRMDVMPSEPQVIEVTAGELSAELHRRGFSDDERVIVTIEPEPELIPGRRESRAPSPRGLPTMISTGSSAGPKGSRAPAASMRLVVDTNILVSAALQHGSLAEIALHEDF
jgi:hypothetical protein